MIIFCAIFAAIGGASLFLPLLIIFYSFGPHLANSHAAVLILASCIARLIYDTSKDDRINRINYRLVLLSLPATSFGVIIGSYLNELTPSLVLFIIIIIVLCALFVTTVTKVINYIRQKVQEAQEDSHQPDKHIKIKGLEEDEIEALVVPFKGELSNRLKEELEYGSDDRPLPSIKPNR